MPEVISIRVAGKNLQVPPGTSVAAAVMLAGAFCRTSVTGQPRTPFCGMGICFECRVTINGRPYIRSCQLQCESGMEITADE
jgi:sarcosine oxidase subunit alpha